MLQDISREVEKIVSTSKTYKNLESREKKRYTVLREWKRQFDGWKESFDGVTRGVQFYTDLSELVEALRRSVISFYNSRTEERNELVKSLDTRQTEVGQRYVIR